MKRYSGKVVNYHYADIKRKLGKKPERKYVDLTLLRWHEEITAPHRKAGDRYGLGFKYDENGKINKVNWT